MAIIQKTFFGNHTGTDPIGSSDTWPTTDDNLRNLAGSLKEQFPNLTASVDKTAAQINDLAEKSKSGEEITGAWSFKNDLNLNNATTQRIAKTLGDLIIRGDGPVRLQGGGTADILTVTGTDVTATAPLTAPNLPTSVACCTVAMPAVTIGNQSSGASGWSVNLTGLVITLTHTLGTAAFVFTCNGQIGAGANAATITKTSTTLVLDYSGVPGNYPQNDIDIVLTVP